MTEITNGLAGSPQNAFTSAHRTRIAQLASGQPTESQSSYVEAVVSLVWPYSNKERVLSLLLAEPDVRLRSAKGQLKVTFHGSGARQVAKSQVGIGDIVLLRIEDATWKNTGDTVLTPGRKVEWDLHFKNRILLEVRRSGNNLTTIDYEGIDTPPPVSEEALPQPINARQVNGFHEDAPIAFATPVAIRARRGPSGSFIDATLDPFADDDGFVLGKGRKRTKFGRTSGSWKLVGEGDSSEDEAAVEVITDRSPVEIAGEDVLSGSAKVSGPTEVIVLDDSSPEISPVKISMPPPPAPFGRILERPVESLPQEERVTTPRLHPLASAGLPLVSPLFKEAGAAADFFSVRTPPSSELDAISVSSTSPQEQRIPTHLVFEESFDYDLPNNLQETVNASKQPLSTIQADSGYGGNTEHYSSIGNSALEALPEVSNEPVTPSSSYSASINLPSSNSQLDPSHQITGFRFNAGNTAVPPTVSSFGDTTGFASFGSPSGFGLLPTPGRSVGFGFGTRPANVDTTAFARRPENSAPEFVANDIQAQPDQSVEDVIDQQLTGLPAPGSTSGNVRRELQISDDDDDMYGSAQPVPQSPSVVRGLSEKPRSISRDVQDPSAIIASFAGTEKAPSTAFHSAEVPNDKMAKVRHQSYQSSLVEDASDELSQSGSSDEEKPVETTMSQPSPSMISPTFEMVESSELVDDETSELASSKIVEEAATFENFTKVQIAVGPVLELEGDLSQREQADERTDPQSINDDGVESDAEDLVTSELEFADLEEKRPQEQNGIIRQQQHEDRPAIVPDEANKSREQLLTPDNTQREAQGADSFEPLQQVSSLQMPPTPDNTQEAPGLPFVQLDGIHELRPLPDSKDRAANFYPTQQNRPEVTPGPHRKSPKVPAISSPYFTVRRSARLSPAREVQDLASKETEKSEVTAQEWAEPEHNVAAQASSEANESSPSYEKRLRNVVGMSTPLSYYTPLSNLEEHFNHQVDLFAICTADSATAVKSKAGPRDYNVTLHLADSFLDDAETITAQVFRPYKSALPVVRCGDVVLLRSFKVQSRKRKLMLLSTESSAWAVFSSSSLSMNDVVDRSLQVDVAGPPVEYGPEEHIHAQCLMKWWAESGHETYSMVAAKPGDLIMRSEAGEAPNKADATNGSDLVTKAMTNGARDQKGLEPIPSSRTANPSKQESNHINNMTNHDRSKENPEPSSPTFEPVSPTQGRITRSSRRATNHTDNTNNEDDPQTAESIEALPEFPVIKTGRRTRRATSTAVDTATPPEKSSRALRSQSTVLHELRYGTTYVDGGHVPTKRDGVHVLRDGTKYVDENVNASPVVVAGKKKSMPSEVQMEGIERVHELRDGTNYIDRSKSPEVRRSARNKRGGSVVHELRDGAKYMDP